MAYKLTLNDIKASEPKGYQLTLNDINSIPASENIAAQAQSQTEPSNTHDLQLFSLLAGNKQSPQDIANLHNLVKPFTGQDIQRTGMALLPGFVPEIGGLGGGLGEYLTNALARTGAGAVSNVGLNKDNIKNMDDVKRLAMEGAKTSAYLEPFFGAGALARQGAEIYNPSYMTGKRNANEMANELRMARDWQQSAYDPVFQAHGNDVLTNNPRAYMQNMGVRKTRLYPEAKKIYDDFQQNPNINNLHAFQSQMFRDIESARSAEKPVSAQYFTQFRQATRDAIRNHLSSDPRALYQYDLGANITRNYVEPYLSTPKLKKLSEGVKEHVTPQEIAHEIRKGQENITGREGGQAITSIGNMHPLNARLETIENALNRAQLMQDTIPDYAKGFVPKFANMVQNPYLIEKLRQARPGFILGGRGFVNQFNQQQ